MIVLSASGWMTYKQCPKKYEYSRIIRVKSDLIEDHSNAIPGSTVHEAAENYLKTFDDSWFSAEAIKSIFDSVTSKPECDLSKYPGGPEKAWEMTLLCAKNLHMFLLGQDLKGKKFYTEFNIGTWKEPCVINNDLGLMGASDLLVPAFDKYVLYDYKATYQRKNVDPDQLKLYKLAVEKILGVSIPMVGFLFIPLSLPQYYSFNDTEMKFFLDKLFKAVDLIQKGSFEKKPSQKCDNCKYRDMCKPEAVSIPVSQISNEKFNFNMEVPEL